MEKTSPMSSFLFDAVEIQAREYRQKGWQTGLSSPAERLTKLLHSSHFSDLTITFPAKKLSVKVHRLVLAMTSPVFEEMLFGSSAVGRELALPNDPPDGFNWLLTHMYGGNTELPCEKIALQVSFLASKYKIKALYSLCSKFLVRTLSKENLLEFYNAAVLLTDNELLRSCLKMLRVCSCEVLSSQQVCLMSCEALKHLLKQRLFITSEVIIFRAVVTWGRAQLATQDRAPTPMALRQEIEELLPLVRFLAMSCNEIVRHVLPSGVFTQEESTSILMNIECSKNAPPLPGACSTLRQKREQFDSGDIKCIQLPNVLDPGLSCKVQTDKEQTLISNLQTNKTIHILKVHCECQRVNRTTATVVDAGGEVLQVVRSSKESKGFENPVTLDPGQTCNITVNIIGIWYSELVPFKIQQNEIFLEGLHVPVYGKSPKIYFWCSNN